jgi:hypothetical protein
MGFIIEDKWKSPEEHEKLFSIETKSRLSKCTAAERLQYEVEKDELFNVKRRCCLSLNGRITRISLDIYILRKTTLLNSEDKINLKKLKDERSKTTQMLSRAYKAISLKEMALIESQYHKE